MPRRPPRSPRRNLRPWWSRLAALLRRWRWVLPLSLLGGRGARPARRRPRPPEVEVLEELALPGTTIAALGGIAIDLGAEDLQAQALAGEPAPGRLTETPTLVQPAGEGTPLPAPSSADARVAST